MKIALVTDSFTTGGGLEHIYQICAGMPDIEFGVFGNGGNSKEKFEILSNVKIFSNGYSKKQIRAFNPDIVHIHHLKPLIKLYNLDIKTIFTVHGIHLHKYEFVDGIKSKIFRFLRLNLEKYLYKQVDKIITVSNDDKEYLEKHYKVDSEVIYNGINYEPILKITDSKEKLRQKLSLPQDKQIYLTVARFDFQKGYDILIDAIGILKNRNQIGNKIFLFAGDGKLLKDMKLKVVKMQLDNEIKFLGIRNDIYELMKASDYLVLPSRWEGLPITLIEAFYLELPQIVSDTYGNLEMSRLTGAVCFRNLDSTDLANKLQQPFSLKQENRDTVYETFMIKNMIKKLTLVYKREAQ